MLRAWAQERWDETGQTRRVDARQTRLKTNVPLVPPNPKLFFIGVLDLHFGRAVLAQ